MRLSVEIILKPNLVTYIKERSKVSSRHKLPTRDEFSSLAVVRVRQFSEKEIDSALQGLLDENKIMKDGPYYCMEVKETE